VKKISPLCFESNEVSGVKTQKDREKKKEIKKTTFEVVFKR
jgi:hypothetical protein